MNILSSANKWLTQILEHLSITHSVYNVQEPC